MLTYPVFPTGLLLLVGSLSAQRAGDQQLCQYSFVVQNPEIPNDSLPGCLQSFQNRKRQLKQEMAEFQTRLATLVDVNAEITQRISVLTSSETEVELQMTADARDASWADGVVDRLLDQIDILRRNISELVRILNNRPAGKVERESEREYDSVGKNVLSDSKWGFRFGP